MSDPTSDVTIHDPIRNDEELRSWLLSYCQLRFPTKGICPGHVSPFEYLRHAYFEPTADVVVWAPRGGGKTRLGAVATLLDLLHKPGAAIRILGGSLEQSLRMWDYLLPDINNHAKDHILGKVGARSLRLVNGSSAGVVTQSQRAVRGLRVQKLRCDEVEMFDPRVWEAAQLVTRSKAGEGLPLTAGVVEAFSTFHQPGGMMERIIAQARVNQVKVLQWCLLEVLQKCPPERECASCPLLADCGGRAKEQCDGFLSIDDAIRMKQRVSKETWDAEMLCKTPNRQGCVFGTFDCDVHVRESLPGVEADRLEVGGGGEGLYLGIDFGFKNPFVCLWVRRDRYGRSFVVDEYVQDYVEVDRHIAEILGRRQWGAVRRVGCDPAGSARNEQTGMSNVTKLRKAGFKVSCRGSRIQDGLERVRLGLRSAAGEVSLYIHPRCRRLVEAMRSYRYGDGRAEVPVKDGPDHLVDALRYYFVNRDGGEVSSAIY